MRTMAVVTTCTIAIVVISALVLATWHAGGPVMFGFTTPHAAAQAALEARFLSLPAPARLDAEHTVQSAEPHVAGSERDYVLTMRARDQFAAAGLENVEVTTHDVL